MAAGPDLANFTGRRPTAAPPTAITARTSAPRSRTTMGSQTAAARDTAQAVRNTTPHDVTSPVPAGGRRGSARQEGSALWTMVRGWLNSPRVARAAIPLAIVAAAIIVVSVFASTASAPSITSEIVASQPASSCTHPRGDHSQLGARGRRSDASQRRAFTGHHTARRHSPRRRATDQLPFSLGRLHRSAGAFPGHHGRQLRGKGRPRSQDARAGAFRLVPLAAKGIAGQSQEG